MNEFTTEMTAWERAARITYLLVGLRKGLTIHEVAQNAGLSRRGAYYLMEAISRVIPVAQEEENGVWRYCGKF